MGCHLYPVRALPQEAEVVTLHLTKLPFEDEQNVEKALRSALAEYGQVLDIWLYTDLHAGWFLEQE